MINLLGVQESGIHHLFVLLFQHVVHAGWQASIRQTVCAAALHAVEVPQHLQEVRQNNRATVLNGACTLLRQPKKRLKQELAVLPKCEHGQKFAEGAGGIQYGLDSPARDPTSAGSKPENALIWSHWYTARECTDLVLPSAGSKPGSALIWSHWYTARECTHLVLPVQGQSQGVR
eukprot:1160065-Pelagomonas_calceolata.AAC.9